MTELYRLISHDERNLSPGSDFNNIMVKEYKNNGFVMNHPRQEDGEKISQWNINDKDIITIIRQGGAIVETRADTTIEEYNIIKELRSTIITHNPKLDLIKIVKKNGN